MSTPDSPLNETATHTHCPLCGAALDPASQNECPKCDWVLGYRRRETTDAGSVRDRLAVLFSIVPGLGHIYKGHRLLGAILMLGSAFAFSAASLAGFASAGWGLLLMPLYWIGVMLHAYWLEDLAAVKPTP